jgi:hypothetical protein
MKALGIWWCSCCYYVNGGLCSCCVDLCLCRPYAEKYAADQDAFFADYAQAHKKLSELGVEWDPSPIDIGPL